MRPCRLVSRRALACAALSVAVAGPGGAAERYYVGPSAGLWSVPANWSETDGGPGGASVPGNDDDVFATRAGTEKNEVYTIKFDKIYPEGTVLDDLVIADTGGAGGTMRVDHDAIPSPIPEQTFMPVLRAKNVIVAAGGWGAYSQTGGKVILDNELHVGRGAGGLGVYDLTAGTMEGTITAQVGYNLGTGTFNHIGGKATLAKLNVGTFVGTGTFNLFPGATLDAAEVNVGIAGGTGTLNQTGGTNKVGSLSVGFAEPLAGKGTYNLSGGTLDVSGPVRIGGEAKAALFKQTGGTATFAGDFTINNFGVGSSAAYQMTGGTLTLARADNRRTFAHSGGDLTVTGEFKNAGSATFGPGQHWPAGSTVVSSAASTTTFNANAGSAAAPTLKLSATGAAYVFFNASQNVDSVSLADGARAELFSASPGRVLHARQVSIDATGALDLNNGGLIADKTATPVASIRENLVRGYDGGNWGGLGILSGTAAGDPGKQHAVGYLDNASGAVKTFFGEDVGADAVLVRYTLYGDANLDGAVNFSDLVALAQNYNQPAGHWYLGDFNYDGQVNFGDLVRLAQNYNSSLPVGAIRGAAPGFESDLGAAFASVPEPGTLGAIAMVALTVAARRRRR